MSASCITGGVPEAGQLLIYAGPGLANECPEVLAGYHAATCNGTYGQGFNVVDGQFIMLCQGERPGEKVTLGLKRE